ncbi:single-stranded DNA-binding protein [Corynebacterium sp. ES2794-CONJ1]|uniref:single-stranded DNA-binding protein n=1 Tax=unclassified Corynebacterium TaxID=2624378 RepID=UPI002168C90D|nr:MULTISPECIES: single-stranded DNA-binding protein [unclassified Corynebacterium]MCS4490679.1 single-stranded DNA-binding protein [Corynebacterium sp. ES2775-CONJ]MCS4492481.1 single-stranded DNA-binding protein [Corynebacterium sp. ES2715-CONJ3]MCS4532555.1 single-stranded DNA-binding protein [Corynebacterium sp. ES2730-CONJ]MCU9519950.1 single-stranded DNA-binding protein [Corynebacterium sp. ES2794-CONJ1]
MLSTTTIVGNLTSDPTVYHFPSGAMLTKFRIASSRYRRDPHHADTGNSETARDSAQSDHSRVENSGFISYNQLYIDVECWGNLAHNAHLALGEGGKGTQVIVLGDLIHKEWEREGKTESRIVVRATHIGVDMRKYACRYHRSELDKARRAETVSIEPESEQIVRDVIQLDEVNAKEITTPTSKGRAHTPTVVSA